MSDKFYFADCITEFSAEGTISFAHHSTYERVINIASSTSQIIIPISAEKENIRKNNLSKNCGKIRKSTSEI